MQTVTIDVYSDWVVLRCDPEMADMTHPRGEVIGEVFRLLATAANGNRWAWGGFESLELALASIESAPPVILWTETYPEYGSMAYVSHGQQEEVEWEARHVEVERFNDSFYVA